jgi:DNA-directed RNA polymerase subunit RPC12/RpoP
MGTFAFKCPACASELEVEDESRGETSECPNCQAEIKIPLVKAPQVRIPMEPAAPATPRPVQKKKLIISQDTAAALAASGRPRKTSKTGVVVGVLVGLVVGIIIGACSPVRLTSLLPGSSRAPQALSFLRPSKGEWKSKLLQNYALQNSRIVPAATDTNNPAASEKYSLLGFQRAIGKPDKIETVGDAKALSYVCNDGQVQVLISSTNYDAGQIVGALVNDE